MATTIDDYIIEHFQAVNGDPGTALTVTVHVWCVEDAAYVVGDGTTGEAMLPGPFGFYYKAYTRDIAKHYLSTAICDLSGRFKYAHGLISPSILSHVVEGTTTLQEAITAILAEACGTVTGASNAVGTINYENVAGGVNRVQKAIADTYGNRTTTLDFSDL